MQTYIRGAAERRRLEHNDRMSLAWHIARLNAYAPQKADRFTPLADLLSSPKSPQQHKQSPDQIMAAARVWMANRQR